MASGADSPGIPDAVVPMQQTLVREPFHRPGWIEEKYDGWRVLAFKDGECVRLVSRNGVDHTDRFDDIAAAIKRLPAERLVLDAEIQRGGLVLAHMS